MSTPVLLERWTRKGVCVVLLSLATLACEANLGDGGDGGSEGTPSGQPPGSPNDPAPTDPATTGLLGGEGEPTGDPNLAGVRGLRLLSAEEFHRTIVDLLGVSNFPEDTFPQDPLGAHGFSEPALVTAERVRGYNRVAEELAEQIDVPALAPCDASVNGDDFCAGEFISKFGLRAYRQPVSEEEATELLSLYQLVRNDWGEDHEAGLGALLTVMLQSPRFLYHFQADSLPPDASGVVQLGPYELASRLSYLLWGTMPDLALFEAAASGLLSTEEGVRAQVRRMMADVRAKERVADFHDQWLDLSRVLSVTKDPTLFPEFDDTIKAALLAESRGFTGEVVVSGDGLLQTLLTADYSLRNATLSSFYGDSNLTSSELQTTPIGDEARRGLLTHASIIAGESNPASTNPARAGFMILSKFLCDSVPPPPPGATAEFSLDDALSVRQNFERLESGEAGTSCTNCHQVLNPLGYGFESFDPIGKGRTHDGPHLVDASGAVTSVDGTFPYDNLADLADALYQAPEMRTCYARKWIRFALGRNETIADLYSLETSFIDFADTNFNIRTYLEALATSRTFRFRTPEEGEVL